MITPAVPFNVEDELAACIASIGGVRVTDLLGRAPGHDNADFFFDQANVVAELKCLDEDKIHDDRIIEKASQLYLQELGGGRALRIVFGTVHTDTGGFTPEFTAKISSLYRTPVERRVRKADKQIGETKQALERPNAGGLLLVANNNHTALDPWHAWKLMDEILQKPMYTHITAAVLFAGNLGAVLPGRSERIDYWLEFHRQSVPAISHTFLETLRVQWFKQLGKLFGSTVATIVPSTLATLVKLESQ